MAFGGKDEHDSVYCDCLQGSKGICFIVGLKLNGLSLYFDVANGGGYIGTSYISEEVFGFL